MKTASWIDDASQCPAEGGAHASVGSRRVPVNNDGFRPRCCYFFSFRNKLEAETTRRQQHLNTATIYHTSGIDLPELKRTCCETKQATLANTQVAICSRFSIFVTLQRP